MRARLNDLAQGDDGTALWHTCVKGKGLRRRSPSFENNRVALRLRIWVACADLVQSGDLGVVSPVVRMRLEEVVNDVAEQVVAAHLREKANDACGGGGGLVRKDVCVSA
eukprot:6173503-Pleurochrysis_carterae.AAC.5